jgi:A/G-specific adenine glycosylase
MIVPREELHRALLSWWEGHRADWPWRESADPYRVWLSEVMLQQTQRATVVPYYTRWMALFPTVAALAEAPLEAVLKAWEGLGYYSRARNLHRAAQEVVARHGGELPRTPEALRTLPGIGRYSAGAIASIAFNLPEPVVDGNVMRVLTRLTDCADDIGRSATQRHLWQLATTLVPADRPGDWNQALMELGQQVCKSAEPECAACPLRFACLAHRNVTQAARPVRTPRRAIPHYDVAAGVIYRDDGRFLIAQRPVNGLLGGLWEFPGGKQEPGEALEQTLVREIREELGIEIRVSHLLTQVRHAYTHFRITLHTFHATWVGGEVQHLGVADHAWVTLPDLPRYPFSAADHKIIAALLKRPRL